jgi:ribonuclease Z
VISHLHGDHFYGLIGLISTFSLLNRKSELHIYGPKGIREIIELQLKLSKSWVEFNLIFHELSSRSSEMIFENKKVEVHTIPLKHRIYTNGFLFREKPRERKLNMSAISRIPDIDICDYQNLKDGKDFVKPNGEVIPNRELTLDPPAPLSYAYCTDTEYDELILPVIEGVDLLYHESTFLEEHLDLAEKTKHSTARQAGTIAQKAKVKKLMLGHYSSRYKNLDSFLHEATQVFENTELSEAGKQILIGH